MSRSDEISFSYKGRLGPVLSIILAAALAPAAFYIAKLGLEVNRDVSLFHMINLGPYILKLSFWILAAGLLYGAVRILVINLGFLKEPRFILISPKGINAPISPTSRQTTSIDFSKIEDIKLKSVGKTAVIEIYHADGQLDIPKYMIESDASFDHLSRVILRKVKACHAQG